jgi:hypothetical protein
VDTELLRFEDEQLASLGHVSDLCALLRAIDETLPKDATHYVEGSSLSPDLMDFLARRRTATRHEVKVGTVWPKPKGFHLPLSGTNLGELRGLAARHAEPEICDHLVVYRESEVLL